MKTKFNPALSNLTLVHQGKTRDTFATTSQNTLLIVATNRLSTHNIVHLSEVPNKGEVLTSLTIYWLKNILERANIPHHLVAYGVDIYKHLPGSRSDYPNDLHHRAIVVKKLKMIPVEFIFRNYLCGSLAKNFYFKNLANPYGIPLRPGLHLMEQFAEPLFTPTDKSETDEPLQTEQTMSCCPMPFGVSSRTFKLIGQHMRDLGLELVDSKFEIGLDETGVVTVADEIATPDSSRFCKLSEIKLGQEPPWLDKQIARDEAERIWGKGEKIPLQFSPEIIGKLSDTYYSIFGCITGFDLHAFWRQSLD